LLNTSLKLLEAFPLAFTEALLDGIEKREVNEYDIRAIGQIKQRYSSKRIVS
jgi:hypothetical protein